MFLPDFPRPRWERFRHAAIPERGPIRTLTKVTLSNTIGNGLYFAISVIFFTRSVGLTNHQVALGFGIAAAAGLIANVPAGHLADRHDPRKLAALFLSVEGLSMGAFVLVHSFSTFLAVSILGSLAGSAGGSVRMAFMARFGVGEERVRVRAFQRSVSNLGMGIGFSIAGVALAADTRSLYVAMVLVNAATFIIAAVLILQIPEMVPLSPTSETKTGPRLVVLRDHHFLIASALGSCLSVQAVVQGVGIPLWIIQYTRAPRWWVAVLMVVNTSAIVLLQVRMSKGTGDLQNAANIRRRSGFYMALACLIYAIAQGLNPVLACLILLVGSAVDVTAELLSVSASWGIGYGMAPEHLQGQYQGVYSMGGGIGMVYGPVFVTSTAIAMGRVGWVILAAFFVLSGAAFPPLIRSYLRARAAAPSVGGDLL
ncbi:MAG TPA: MFS transporter [Candidatus Nanopelagicaceae bacterium]|nr:MFS transporter [Candidatus Nanopelagicaceae bacterium]